MLNNVLSFVETLPNKPFIKTRTQRQIEKVYREEVKQARPPRSSFNIGVQHSVKL